MRQVECEKAIELECKKANDQQIVKDSRKKLGMPFKAFVTFEFTEAVNMLTNPHKEEATEVKVSSNSPIIEAPMPSNLKWERRKRKGTGCCACFNHKFWSYVAISMIIWTTSSIIYYLRFQTQKAVSPFRQLRCQRMFNQFESEIHNAFEKTKTKL